MSKVNKKIVSWLCILVLVAGCFPGNSFVSKAERDTELDTLPIEPIEPEEELTEYQMYTFEDLGLSGTYTKQVEISWLYGFDKVGLVGEITFSNRESGNGLFWTTPFTNGYKGINIRTYGGVYIEDSYVGGSGFSVGKNSIGVDSIVDTPITITMLFDTNTTENTVTMTLKLNNYESTMTYSKEKMDEIEYLAVMATSDIPITLESVALDEVVRTKTPLSYNLRGHDHVTPKSYLVMGNATVTKNGTDYKLTNNAISEPGDYTVTTHTVEEASLRSYTQNVALYILGDTNLDGNAGGMDDYTVLEQLVQQQPYAPTKAAEFAADLDNDGMVGAKDLELLASTGVAEGTEATQTLEAILNKYHVPAQTYDYIGGNDVMPIGGYYGPFSTHLNEDVFQKIKDSGINMVVYAPQDIALDFTVRKQLSLASKYGLGWFVDDSRLNPKINIRTKTVNEEATMLSETELATKLGQYSYSDSFLGISIIDEPIYTGSSEQRTSQKYRALEYYTDISKQLNSYANLTGLINSVASDSWTVNLYKNKNTDTGTVTGAQWGYKDKELYDEYWEQFTNKENGAGAQVYSADDYPCKNGQLGGGVYFRTLGMLRNQSLANSTPFWFYAQAGGDFDDSDDYDEQYIPTEAKTYWNVNTALAFGAKGIEWFPLVQSSDMNGTGAEPVEKCGVLYSNGEKSRFYNWVKNANAQIAAVDEVLMKAQSTAIVACNTAKTSAAGTVDGDRKFSISNIFQGGYYNETISTTIVQDSYGKLSSVSSTHTQGALVGCFDYRDTEAFYVVNFNADGTDNDTITVTLDDAYDYRCIQDGKETYGTATGNTVTLSLAPGTAALLVLEDRTVAYNRADITPGVAPDAEPGYTFLGWFRDEACSTSAQIKDIGSYEGTTLYAKFVADEVLSVKAQLSADAKSLDEQDKPISMRFVSSVYVSPGETLQYKTVGFKIVKKAETPVERIIKQKTVYQELQSKYGKNTQTWTPSDIFGQMAGRFYAYSIWNIPQDAHDIEYEVTPYWITLDGTTVYGQTAIKTVNQGLKALEN